MPDMSAFDAAERHGGTLKIDTILQQLEPDKAEALQAALADRHYSGAAIARAVTGWGHPVSEAAVRNWRDRNA